MSERSIRVNELILRELSHILRTRFRDQTVAITLTEVNVSPDLRSGRVYYSVIGDERAKIKARSFFTKEYRTLRQLVAQQVILKYFPKINFIEDDSIARGNRVLDLLGELDGMDAHAPDDQPDTQAEQAEWVGEDGEEAWNDADDDSSDGDASDDWEEGDEDEDWDDEDFADDEDADDESADDESVDDDADDEGASDDDDAAEDDRADSKRKSSAARKPGKTKKTEYVFDEDDLEYVRDIAADEAALGALDEDDLDDEDFEEFDEQSDVEYDGDLDDEEGFGKNGGR